MTLSERNEFQMSERRHPELRYFQSLYAFEMYVVKFHAVLIMKWLLLLHALAVSFSSNLTSTVSLSSNNAQIIESNLLAGDIYNAVGAEHLHDNIVISTAAIQMAMALAYYGAKGRTATELQVGIRLGSSDPEEVVRRFANYQQRLTQENNIRLATNIYINENLEFKDKFRETAQRHFDANIEKVDFHPPYNKRTVQTINRFMETKTNGKITNIIKPEILHDLTEGIIVNGISFISVPWQKAFNAAKTTQRAFRNTNGQTIQVNTMYTLNNFRYAEPSNLDAKVVELLYENADYAMLLILPNKKDGLVSLQRQLAGKNWLTLIDSELSEQRVEIRLPKFSVSFGIGLKQPLKKLGVNTMFTRDGDFGNMYRMFVSHYINAAIHKAYIEITEIGNEPPLESGVLKNFFTRTKKFNANHPFVFALKHKDTIIFVGHIAT